MNFKEENAKLIEKLDIKLDWGQEGRQATTECCDVCCQQEKLCFGWLVSTCPYRLLLGSTAVSCFMEDLEMTEAAMGMF